MTPATPPSVLELIRGWKWFGYVPGQVIDVGDVVVERGGTIRALIVDREGRTTVDMANGPVQRIQPFPETIALLEKLGAKNNHKCVSC